MSRIAPYAFKAQLDEFVYFTQLSKPLRPFVYRAKNADRLLSQRGSDKNGRQLVPRTYPGVPSNVRTAQFIGLLQQPEELAHFRTTLAGLAQIKIKTAKGARVSWMKPSVIDAFLVKSAQMGCLGDSLAFVNTLAEYRYTPRNAETITLLRYFALNEESHNLEWFARKTAQLKKNAGLNEFGSALMPFVELAAQLKFGAVSAATVANAKQVVAKFRADLVHGDDFANYDHAYSIIKTLMSAAEGNPQPEIVALLAPLQPFVANVEAIKPHDVQSTFEKLHH